MQIDPDEPVDLAAVEAELPNGVPVSIEGGGQAVLSWERLRPFLVDVATVRDLREAVMRCAMSPAPEGTSDVRFYRASDKPWGVFSNLYRRPVLFEGVEFPTAEHAYQYGKPRKEAVRDWLMAAPSPGLLAMAAHGLYPWDIAPGWSSTKVDRMRRVLAAKFEQHPDLKETLLSTGTARIVETPTVDDETARFWGEVNGRGRNTLGLLLMELRERLRAAREVS